MNPQPENTDPPVLVYAVAPEPNRRAIFTLGALLVPFVAIAIFIVVTRSINVWNPNADILATIAGACLGGVFLFLVPVRPLGLLLMILLIYLPLMAMGLFSYGLIFVGVVYGRWL